MSRERRRYSREFKLAALARLKEVGHVGDLAAELGVRRELLYKWRVKYEAGGAEALSTTGRPRSGPARLEREELAQARIAELERTIGRQQLELDFFRAALQQVKDRRWPSGGRGGPASTR